MSKILYMCLYNLLFLILIVDTSYHSQRKRRCTDVYPILGNWNNEVFETRNCDYHYLSVDEIRQCLNDRSLFFLGNSIARQFAFEIPRLLQYERSIASREEEKNMCPKHFTDTHQTFGCSFYLPNNTNIHVDWFLYHAGRPNTSTINYSSLQGWDNDACGNLTSIECLKLLGLDRAKESDILLFNMGIADALWDPIGVTAIKQWRQNNVREFVKNVRNLFNGTVVYMTVSPMNDDRVFSRTIAVNEQISDIIRKETNWLMFDSWATNIDVLKTRFYADTFHYPGELTKLSWNIILSGLCD